MGLGWRLASSGISLPNNVFSWLLSDFTGPFSRPKNPSKTCAPQGASPEENAGSDGDDIGIARLLMATAAMKNQTDRFYTTAIVFAGRSVFYTTLFEPPLPPIQWLSLVRESDTECWGMFLL